MPRRRNQLSPTMIDVARLAGVSQSCVSLVLNEAPGARLPEATKQRVRRAAQQLGYQLPSRGSRQQTTALARDEPSVIAYVVDEISLSPHAVLQADGARDAAWACEHTVQMHVARANRDLEAAAFRAILRDPSIVGVIYASSFTREIVPPEELHSLPAVLVNCYSQNDEFCTSLPDEVSGGLAATRYLISYGHRRIGMISGERWMDAARDRIKGYKQALADAGIPADPALVSAGDWTAESGYKRTRAFMRLQDPPTAFYCANDMMALGALQALSELGFSVPRDISIVGHNDLELDRHIRPPLSSCRTPNYSLGKLAAEVLLDAVRSGERPAPKRMMLECQLITRSSVAPYHEPIAQSADIETSHEAQPSLLAG